MVKSEFWIAKKKNFGGFIINESFNITFVLNLGLVLEWKNTGSEIWLARRR